jgi:hypothetical protein
MVCYFTTVFTLDPIQLVWIGESDGAARNVSFTNPDRLDGVYSKSWVRTLAHHLIHRSAQGGWGLHSADYLAAGTYLTHDTWVTS